MPKYYCDYCDTYLTHDSPSVRKTHCQGRKHKDNVKFYYQKWMEDQAQQLIDATTAMYKAGKVVGNPFGPHKGVAIPPPPTLAVPSTGLPPMPVPGMHQGMMPPPPGMPPPGVGMMVQPMSSMMRPGTIPPMMMSMPPMAQMSPLMTNPQINMMPPISQ